MAQVVTLRQRAVQSRDAIELLSNKWRITILHILRDAPLRTNAIQTAIPEVSPKMLTQTLRGMERDGLLVREVHQSLPVRVEYRLTPMGQSLLKPLRDLCQWAKAHVEERDRARRQFDRSAKPIARRMASNGEGPPPDPGPAPGDADRQSRPGSGTPARSSGGKTRT